MLILSIETSCDETSIALIKKVTSKEKSYIVLAHETISQINKHREYGGVYPTLSRREHEKNLVPLLHKVFSSSGFLKQKNQKSTLETFSNEIETRDDSFIIEKLGDALELLERYEDLKENVFDFFSKYELSEKIDFIAVTNGPGLPPALWVGVNFAKVISILLGDIPIYPINHLEGHIIGAITTRENDFVKIINISYPTICLLISGGHTELVLSKKPGHFEKIGETQDDALGEAYDKVARLLNLPYPGGPEMDRLAKIGREKGVEPLDFPRPMIHSKDLNFSFSGLKTHILYLTQKLGNVSERMKIRIATEFEKSVLDVLTLKTKNAVEEYGSVSLIVGGGASSNVFLKENFAKIANKMQLDLYYSTRELATDNALMIALTCANQIENGLAPTKEFLAVGSKDYKWGK